MNLFKDNKFIKLIHRKYSRIKDYSILVVPHNSTSETKSYKLSTRNVILLFVGYSFVGSILGFIFYSSTGLGSYILPAKKSTELHTKEQVLVDKINLLLQQLEGMRTSNEKLKKAVLLGDSTLINKSKTPDTSLIRTKTGGNVFRIFKELFFSERDSLPENPYFIKPVNGFISRDFNPDIGHFGVDYVVKTGTPVYSAGNGFVIFSEYSAKDGYTIIIMHPGNFISFYKHCSSVLKKERDNVTQGEIIALSGNTGLITTGPHLHFELWEKGIPVNPRGYLINY